MKNLGYYIGIILLIAACAEANVGPGNETGQGGSLARFTIVDNYLYTVDPENLKTFDISSPANLFEVSQTQFPWFQGVETIFPFNNNLFLGTESGMLIFDLSDPTNPTQIGEFSHIRSCDPVVTDGEYAFVTLRNAQVTCSRGVNQLDILDVTDLTAPKLVRSYPMTSPKGLGLRGDELFICDAGLKVYDVSDVTQIDLISSHPIPANDVIVHSDKIIVIADDGLYQYVTTQEGLQLLSEFKFIND